MSPFPTSATTRSTSAFRVSNVEYGIELSDRGIGVPSIDTSRERTPSPSFQRTASTMSNPLPPLPE